jgi:hypothetical protein
MEARPRHAHSRWPGRPVFTSLQVESHPQRGDRVRWLVAQLAGGSIPVVPPTLICRNADRIGTKILASTGPLPPSLHLPRSYNSHTYSHDQPQPAGQGQLGVDAQRDDLDAQAGGGRDDRVGPVRKSAGQ